ncbi:hypothetical protein [Thiohalomonas denitrificans]|uniref:hypothetical protein n=1 Tax=Thiohalomonas denitrificans TaxID=415747 RepID=UPI000B857CF5|nr:hypothetical protein [Thiohalomonas denitrificans]
MFTDARQALTWGNRFRGALGTETYNFYSSGEDVVENPNPSENVNSNVWDVIIKVFTFDNQKGRHTWVAQEIAKGSDSLLIAPLMGHQHGGWGYNGAYDGQSGVLSLDKETFRLEPFFSRFEPDDAVFSYTGDVLFASDQDSAADTEAAKLHTQFKLLAEAIPARSFAAAANPLEPLDTFGENNFDMMGFKNQGRWTTERPVESNGIRAWWHSDFRAVALTYTSPMWEKMIALGGLGE